MDAVSLDFRGLMKREKERARRERRMLAQQQQQSSAGGNSIGNNIRSRIMLDESTEVRSDSSASELRGVYYIPSYISGEEAALLENAVQSTDPKKWKDLERRRLLVEGGTPHHTGMVPEPMPPYLHSLCQGLVEAGIFPKDRPPNHVLLNEYVDGQGIGPHLDGDLYDDRVAIISLGSEANLDFYKSKDTGSEPVLSVLCQHRSLVLFTGDDAYRNHYHGIEARDAPGEKRLSFTVRHVKKVLDEDQTFENAEWRDERKRIEIMFERSVKENAER